MSKKRWFLIVLCAVILSILSLPLCSDHLIMGIYSSRYSNKTARIDVFNSAEKDASFKMLSGTTHHFPDWCKKDTGNCVVITEPVKYNWRWKTIKLQVVGNGNVRIKLMGPDKQVNTERYPVVVEYRNFRINGKDIMLDKRRVWHDSPYVYSFSAKNGDILTITFETRNGHIKLSDFTKVYQLNLKLLFSIFVFAFLFSYKLIQWIMKFKIIERFSKSDIVFLSVFFVLLLLPMMQISKEKKSWRENRMFASQPVLIHKKGINLNYGNDFKKWFNDRFFGRDILLSAYANIFYYTNRVFENHRALYDKETQWMFNKPLVANLLTETTIQDVIKNIQQFDTFCRENNARLYVLIVPKKERVYSDELSFYGYDFQKDSAFKMQIKQVQEALSDARVVYPYSELIQGKEKDFVFFKSAHHWTDWGAYIGYQSLMKRISNDFPDIKIVSLDNYTVSHSNEIRDDYPRDYNKGHTLGVLNIREKADDILTETYNYYDYIDTSIVSEKRGHYIKDFNNFEKNVKYRLFLTGNSQNENLLQYLPYSFKTMQFLRMNRGQQPAKDEYKFMKLYKNDLITFKPDIVVVTISENIIAEFAKFYKD